MTFIVISSILFILKKGFTMVSVSTNPSSSNAFPFFYDPNVGNHICSQEETELMCEVLAANQEQPKECNEGFTQTVEWVSPFCPKIVITFTSSTEHTLQKLKQLSSEEFLQLTKNLEMLLLREFSYGLIPENITEIQLIDFEHIHPSECSGSLAFNIYFLLTRTKKNKDVQEIILGHIQKYLSLDKEHVISIAFTLSLLGFFCEYDYINHAAYKNFKELLISVVFFIFQPSELVLFVYALRGIQFQTRNISVSQIILKAYSHIIQKIDHLSPCQLAMVMKSSLLSNFTSITDVLDVAKAHVYTNVNNIDPLTPLEVFHILDGYFSFKWNTENSLSLTHVENRIFFQSLIQKLTNVIDELPTSNIVRVISELSCLKLTHAGFFDKALQELIKRKDFLTPSEAIQVLQKFCETRTIRNDSIVALLQQGSSLNNLASPSFSVEMLVKLSRAILIRFIQSDNSHGTIFQVFIKESLNEISQRKDISLDKTHEDILKSVVYVYSNMCVQNPLSTDTLERLTTMLHLANVEPNANPVTKFQENVLLHLNTFFQSLSITVVMVRNVKFHGLMAHIAIPELYIYVILENNYIFDEKGKRYYSDSTPDKVAEINNVHLIRICNDEWPGCGKYSNAHFDALRRECLEHKLKNLL